ncbi:hypothetical protein GGH95_000009 [Coemansia sp. RSA 1836]|nr:hypothetical protein GGH95_000009 [Coemansia sp. RSA 1836]
MTTEVIIPPPPYFGLVIKFPGTEESATFAVNSETDTIAQFQAMVAERFGICVYSFELQSPKVVKSKPKSENDLFAITTIGRAQYNKLSEGEGIGLVTSVKMMLV